MNSGFGIAGPDIMIKFMLVANHVLVLYVCTKNLNLISSPNGVPRWSPIDALPGQ